MSINIEKLKTLNDLVNLSTRKKHIIVLNPEERYIENLDENIEYDKAEWKIPNELSTYIDELARDNKLSIEDKILLIFERICKDYIYDDNLISYIKKIDDDTFSVPDWYGRDIDNEWEENRKEHNRRNCYELSRYLAKGLTELLKNNEDYNVSIQWNKDLTHYFVGLICSEYSITLDTDDFFNIKDLTRIKVGLTAEGIVILEDTENKFKNAMDKFNQKRSKYAIKKIEHDIEHDSLECNEEMQQYKEKEENEDIVFLKKAIEILVTKYNMDSQGIYEYMKEIIDIRIGSQDREKLWKKIEGKTRESTRYIRCLCINIDNQKYLIDVDEKIIRPFDEKEFENKRTSYVRYEDLSRGGFDYYDGT